MSDRYSLRLEIPPLTDAEVEAICPRRKRDGKRATNITKLPMMQADVMQRHLRSKYRKVWADRVRFAVLAAGGAPKTPLQAAQIVGIRYCTGRQGDRPSIWYSFKPLVDALNGWVIQDDSPEILSAEDYYSVRVRTKSEQRIVLTVVGV